MRKIAGTRSPSGAVPACKQCLEAEVMATGRERVVRFMGAWACLDHFMVEVKGKENKVPLSELLRNRAHRRQLGRGHRVKTA